MVCQKTSNYSHMKIAALILAVHAQHLEIRDMNFTEFDDWVGSYSTTHKHNVAEIVIVCCDALYVFHARHQV